MKHKIDLQDDQPFKQICGRIPSNMYEDVKSHMHQLLRTGIIRKSQSPWSSKVAVIKKKNNTLGLCVDCRVLNLRRIFIPWGK